jgi:tRNA threonylcarbamoyladenosine biosynthesis protein TsaB
MKILALDTSGTNCSVCVLDENKVICDFNLSTGTTHSQTLLPMIDTLKKFSNIDLDDIDVLACSIGPGSFTGLRIGIATIKGFALSLNKKVIGVPTLVGLAYNTAYFDGYICSVLDAKNDNVYAGIFKYENGKPILKDNYITDDVSTLIDILKNKNDKILFVGDGALAFKERFEISLGDKAFFAPIHLNNQLSSSIAKAALDKALLGEFDDYNTLNPLYLKKSQAERMLEQDGKLNNN